MQISDERAKRLGVMLRDGIGWIDFLMVRLFEGDISIPRVAYREIDELKKIVHREYEYSDDTPILKEETDE